MRKIFILGCILLSSLCIALSQSNGANITDHEQLVSSFLYLVDKQGDLSIDQIEGSESIHWLNHTTHPHVMGTDEVIWIKSSVINSEDRERSMLLEFDGYVDVKIWFYEEGQRALKASGHYVPFVNKDYGSGNRNLIKLDVGIQDEIPFFVRLTKSSDLLHNQPTSLSFNIIPEELFAKNEIKRRSIFSLLIGVLAAMFFYNLFVYFSVRERPFIYYLILILCFIFQIEHLGGYDVQYLKFFPGYAARWGQINLPFSNLIGTMVLLFCVSFFNVRERYPRYHKISQILLFLLITSTIPVVFGGKIAAFAFQIALFLSLLVIVFVITIGIKSLRARYPSAGYYLLAQSVFLLAGIIHLLSLAGVLPVSDISLYAVPTGSTIEQLLFSFALGNRINVLKKENAAKQQLIIKQLQEKEEFQEKVNIELEQKVADRTSEIEKQKQEIEQEKIKSEKLLLNILPKEVARELAETGHAEAKHYHHVSVLFSDFVGFTEYAKMLSPREIVKELDFYFMAFDQIVERNGLEKIKTIGDAYMAVGGLPIANESNAYDAINAGLEMQDFVEKIRSKKEEIGEPFLQLRLGINTGEVVAGVVGKNKFAYDVWGNTVNIANRIELAGLRGKVNVSFSTYQLAKKYFKFKARGVVEMKGMGEAPMFTVEEKIIDISNINPNDT